MQELLLDVCIKHCVSYMYMRVCVGLLNSYNFLYFPTDYRNRVPIGVQVIIDFDLESLFFFKEIIAFFLISNLSFMFPSCAGA